MYSRRKAADDEALELLGSKILEAAGAVKSAVLEDADSKQHKTKRVKPILQMALSVAQLLTAENDNHEAAKNNSREEAKCILLETTFELASSTTSPALVQLCERISTMLEKRVDDAEGGASKRGKGKGKRKAAQTHTDESEGSEEVSPVSVGRQKATKRKRTKRKKRESISTKANASTEHIQSSAKRQKS